MTLRAETDRIDLQPAADELRRLLDGVDDDHLVAPTPCDGMPVAQLLDHLMGLCLAFSLAARKATVEGDDRPGPPTSRAEDLDPAWRTSLPRRLTDLVEAWRDPAAWEGMATAGGVTMPGEVMGMVALDEIVLHGWDLARATGQPYRCDAASTAVVLAFATDAAKPENADQREGLFGPVVEVRPDASDFDRALGRAGRDPGWTPAPA